MRNVQPLHPFRQDFQDDSSQAKQEEIKHTVVFFPNGLQKTDGSFVEKVEDCEVDMRIEVGIKAEIDDGNDENENIEHHEIPNGKASQEAFEALVTP